MPAQVIQRVSIQLSMKWLVVLLSAVALILSGYAIYKANKTDLASKPQVRSIAAAVRPQSTIPPRQSTHWQFPLLLSPNGFRHAEPPVIVALKDGRQVKGGLMLIAEKVVLVRLNISDGTYQVLPRAEIREMTFPDH